MPTSNASLPFVAMAERINLNADQSFAGAVCIVPPDGENAVEILLLTKPDPAMFWSLVKTKAEIALQELANEEAQRAGGWGSVRR